MQKYRTLTCIKIVSGTFDTKTLIMKGRGVRGAWEAAVRAGADRRRLPRNPQGHLRRAESAPVAGGPVERATFQRIFPRECPSHFFGRSQLARFPSDSHRFFAGPSVSRSAFIRSRTGGAKPTTSLSLTNYSNRLITFLSTLTIYNVNDLNSY